MNIRAECENLIKAKNKLEKLLNEGDFDPLTKSDLNIILNRLNLTRISLEIEMEENK